MSITLQDVCYYALLSSPLLVLTFKLFSKSHKNILYPPGPPGYPLVGNLKLPQGQAWKAYRDIGEAYGSDIIRFNILGTNIIVLNSPDIAVELFDKRSSIYSDRPQNGITMISELCGLNWTFGLKPYGKEWRDGRKAFQREFHATAVKRFRPMELNEVHKLLHRLLYAPDSFLAHIRLMAGAVVLSIAYGIEVKGSDDPYITTAEHAMEAVNATMTPGAYLVDFIPALKYIPEWFPGAHFKRQARVWRNAVMDTLNKPWELVKAAADTDDFSGSAAKALMEQFVNTAEDPSYMEKVVKEAVGSMYIGGTDTTVSLLSTFFLAMVLYPDVQRRAQQSLDKICASRLPDFSDIDSLPYIHAVVKECLRWHPVLSLVPPHRSTKDDVFNNFFIPEGSIVFANNGAILSDPKIFINPDLFNPERFLKMEESSDAPSILDPDILDPVEVAFGFGRRICPGRYMAYEVVWVTVACILTVFKIERYTDAHGETIPMEDYSDGFVSMPKPFKCKISPRSELHASLALDNTL